MTMEVRRGGQRSGGLLVGGAVWAAGGLLLALAACSNRAERPAPAGGAKSGPTDGYASVADSCAVGAERECYLTLAVREHELTCYEGVETCTEEGWGDCEKGETVTRSAPAAWAAPSGSRWLAISDPVECDIEENPCNPRCWHYAEIPDPAPRVPDGDPPEGLIGGLPTDAPGQSGCYWGNDCQYNYRCEVPVTDAACAHDKCETGGALGGCRSTDPCVGAICNVRSACCDTSWDAACVDMVHSVCDAFCNEPVPCEHQICTPGAPLTCNDPCVSAVCEQNSGCCETAWDETCVDLAAHTPECDPLVTAGSVPSLGGVADLCNYVAYSETDFTIMQGGVAAGRIGCARDMNLTNATLDPALLRVGRNLTINNSSVTGRAEVAGNITLSNSTAALYRRTDIPSTPPVYAGGSVTMTVSGASLTNDVHSPLPPSGPGVAGFTGTHTPHTGGVSVPALSVAAPTPVECSATQTAVLAADGTLPPNAESANPNAAYAAVHQSGTLHLREGRYVFQTLQMFSDSTLELDFGSAGIDIHVCDTLDLGSYALISTPESFTDLRWFVYGSGTGTPATAARIDVQGGPCRVVPGVFVVPNSRVYVAPNTHLGGVMYANEIQFEPAANEVDSGYASTMCDAAASPQCNFNYVAAPAPPPREAGECFPWELGDSDEDCALGGGRSGVDLALGMPCANNLVVCNHGTEQAPAGVELALFEPSVEMSASIPVADTTNSDYLGSCFTTSPIPSGDCLEQTCASGLLDQAANVVAISPDGTTECNLIENWTAYDPDVACLCVLADTAARSVDTATCRVAFTDVNAVNVAALRWAQTDGVTAQVGDAGGATGCVSDALAYYVDGSNLVLCPDTCTAVVGAPDTRLEVVGPCGGTPYISTAFTEIYQGTCADEGAGTAPQWDILSWESITPNDSNITFEVRLAQTEEALAAEDFHLVGTASSVNDSAGRNTQICDAFAYRADCPVVLPRVALEERPVWEMQQLRNAFLELKVTPNPGSMLRGNDQIPKLYTWDVSYSCLDNE